MWGNLLVELTFLAEFKSLLLVATFVAIQVINDVIFTSAHAQRKSLHRPPLSVADYLREAGLKYVRKGNKLRFSQDLNLGFLNKFQCDAFNN